MRRRFIPVVNGLEARAMLDGDLVDPATLPPDPVVEGPIFPDGPLAGALDPIVTPTPAPTNPVGFIDPATLLPDPPIEGPIFPDGPLAGALDPVLGPVPIPTDPIYDPMAPAIPDDQEFTVAVPVLPIDAYDTSIDVPPPEDTIDFIGAIAPGTDYYLPGPP